VVHVVHRRRRHHTRAWHRRFAATLHIPVEAVSRAATASVAGVDMSVMRPPLAIAVLRLVIVERLATAGAEIELPSAVDWHVTPRK
jgi:hypothetical protein